MFEEHVRSDLENGWVRFGRPHSSFEEIFFHVFGGTLFVTGDLGSAVYRWETPITLSGLSGCHLGYFVGKCEASEVGRDFYQWSGEACRKAVHENVPKDACGVSNPHLFHDALGATESPEEWASFLESTFEMDDFEAHSWGYVVHPRARSHWLALQALFKSSE